MKRLSILTAIALSFTSCDNKGSANGNSTSKDGGSQSTNAKQLDIANKFIDSMGEFATAITKVSDAKSAQAAAGKINEIGDRFTAFAEELKPLDPPGREIKEDIQRKIMIKEAEMRKVMKGDFLKTMQALHPDAQRTLTTAFQEFFEKMQNSQKEFDRHFKVDS